MLPSMDGPERVVLEEMDTPEGRLPLVASRGQEGVRVERRDESWLPDACACSDH